MLKAQKGVPIPKTIHPAARKSKYPFATMAKGEFFFIPDKDRNTMYSRLYTEGQKLGRKFSSKLCYMRKTREGWAPCEETERGATLGVGVWRVK